MIMERNKMMKIEIIGKNNTRIPSKTSDYANKKIKKLLTSFNPSEISGVVVALTDRANTKRVEININTLKLKIRAEENGTRYEEAIDLCIDKLQRQILKHKDKLTSFLKKDTLAKENADLDVKGLEKEILATQLVRKKQIELKPMTKDEAILAMEMIGHDFYIYYDVELDKTCVIYRREDQNYAVIETNIQA